MAVALKREELQLIGEYVQDHLAEWLPERQNIPANFRCPLELTERMIRVEEELKTQRELMKQGFNQIDKRLELMQNNMDKRFEQVDKRFEQVDKRFDQIDKRFEQIDKRFDQIDKRFERVDKHFDEVNTRIENMQTKMFHFMIWSSGFTATVAGIVIAVIKFT